LKLINEPAQNTLSFQRKYYMLRPLELETEILVFFCHKYTLKIVEQESNLKVFMSCCPPAFTPD